MKLHLVFVGKTTEKYLLEGLDDFMTRLSRYATVTIDVVKASTIRDITKAMEEEEKNENEQEDITEKTRGKQTTDQN